MLCTNGRLKKNAPIEKGQINYAVFSLNKNTKEIRVELL